RHFSYSQLSQRYVDESEVGFVLPPEIQEGTPAFEIWKKSCERALEDYRALLAEIEEQVQDEPKATMRRKRARQTARSVLPNAAETKIVVTGNARAWRHFLEMRGSASAEAEIRELALKVLEVLQAEAPHLFGDYRVVEQPGAYRVIETDFAGVCDPRRPKRPYPVASRRRGMPRHPGRRRASHPPSTAPPHPHVRPMETGAIARATTDLLEIVGLAVIA